MKIVFATGNGGKLREASEILGGGFELVTPAQMGITDDVQETGLTLKANSIIKAEHIWKSCGCSCFADDTGLEVNALGGAPGVRTARYAGEDKDYGMDELGWCSEYLDPLFHNNVIGVFNNLLADARKHPLSVRRYMWKFNY